MLVNKEFLRGILLDVTLSERQTNDILFADIWIFHVLATTNPHTNTIITICTEQKILKTSGTTNDEFKEHMP